MPRGGSRYPVPVHPAADVLGNVHVLAPALVQHPLKRRTKHSFKSAKGLKIRETDSLQLKRRMVLAVEDRIRHQAPGAANRKDPDALACDSRAEMPLQG